MIPLILRRMAQLPLILLVIYTLTLALAWGVPGSPLDAPEGRRPPPEVERLMRAQYRLDSFSSFYWSYIENATGVAHVLGHAAPGAPVFDLGPSLQYRDRRVNELIADALPVSMSLGAAAVVIALVLGVAVGTAGALRPGTWVDLGSLTLSLVGVSLPGFVIGSVLLLVFCLWLGWFPVGPWQGARSMALPAITLALPIAAYVARLVRLELATALASEYVRTARAKGLSEPAVIIRHALRNALLPVLGYLGPAAAGAMTGSFVVEQVFSVPGMGQHFVSAVRNKDLFLIIGVVLVYATLLVLFNLAVDILYRWADPRIGDRSLTAA